jgi:hypothetical protein
MDSGVQECFIRNEAAAEFHPFERRWMLQSEFAV